MMKISPPSFARRQRLVHSLRDDHSAAAVIEFCLLLPLFALIIVGAIDFGLAFDAKLRLSNAVGEGAQFSFLTGPNVQAAQVQTVVQSASTLSPVAVNVTYSASACYCLTGSPALLTPQSCSTFCANGTPPGKYLSIAATYTYRPIFPSYHLLANSALSENATVRVQ